MDDIRSRRKGGAPPTFKKKRSLVLPQPLERKDKSSTTCSKTRTDSPQVIRGKRRELLSSRELPLPRGKSPFNLENIEETSLLAREEGAPRHLILDKKRVGASSNLMRKKRAPPQRSRQAPPTSRAKTAPFTPQSARRDFLTLLVKERDPDYLIYFSIDGREHTLKKQSWSYPNLETKKPGPPPGL